VPQGGIYNASVTEGEDSAVFALLMQLDRAYRKVPADEAAPQEPAELAPMLRPFAADRMRAFPVSPVVNNPKNDDARCIEPA
jgi:hypothetical protein